MMSNHRLNGPCLQCLLGLNVTPNLKLNMYIREIAKDLNIFVI